MTIDSMDTIIKLYLYSIDNDDTKIGINSENKIVFYRNKWYDIVCRTISGASRADNHCLVRPLLAFIREFFNPMTHYNEYGSIKDQDMMNRYDMIAASSVILIRSFKKIAKLF